MGLCIHPDHGVPARGVPEGKTAAEAAVATMPGAFGKRTFLNMFKWVDEKGYEGEEHFQKYHARIINELRAEGRLEDRNDVRRNTHSRNHIFALNVGDKRLSFESERNRTVMCPGNRRRERPMARRMKILTGSGDSGSCAVDCSALRARFRLRRLNSPMTVSWRH
jgi:hypothetical protein